MAAGHARREDSPAWRKEVSSFQQFGPASLVLTWALAVCLRARASAPRPTHALQILRPSPSQERRVGMRKAGSGES